MEGPAQQKEERIDFSAIYGTRARSFAYALSLALQLLVVPKNDELHYAVTLRAHKWHVRSWLVSTYMSGEVIHDTL